MPVPDQFNLILNIACFKFIFTSHGPTCNIYKVVSLNLFFEVWTYLINSNVFYNHIFIYYRDNHKYNIYI